MRKNNIDKITACMHGIAFADLGVITGLLLCVYARLGYTACKYGAVETTVKPTVLLVVSIMGAIFGLFNFASIFFYVSKIRKFQALEAKEL